jgi:hypothetical protein
MESSLAVIAAASRDSRPENRIVLGGSVIAPAI